MIIARLVEMVNSMRLEINSLEEIIEGKIEEAEQVTFQDNAFHRGVLEGSISHLEGRKEALEEDKKKLERIIALG